MTEALGLRGGENVLEIGTGSGYAAAVLAHIAGAIHTIERIPGLAEKARVTLERLGYRTFRVIHGDGTLGWMLGAPYDAIAVTAQGPPHSTLPARAAKIRRPPGHASQRGRR